MNFDRTWTVFALDAEYDSFGASRIVRYHNGVASMARTRQEEMADQIATLQADNARLRNLLENFSNAFHDGTEENNLRSAMQAYGHAVDMELGYIKDESEATDGVS